jgi:hypothetical protein
MKRLPATFLLVCTFGLVGITHARGQDPATPRSTKNSIPVSASRLANVDEIRKQLGLTPGYDNLPAVETLKVAVLDYGFEGVNGGRRYLPEDSVVVEHYDPEFVRQFHLGDPEYRKPFAPQNAHGRTMAQIIWAVTGFNPHGPKFYLLNANGPTMLRRAVRYAIENKIDIILFSNTFEGGGNGDGCGPINRVVADALAAGIIWINAAGNFGGHVFNGPVEILPSAILRLGTGADQTALRFRNLLDENSVTITLTWNDYREQEDAGTSKDLDLYVEDHLGNVIGSSEKKQVVAGKNDPEESRNPRERVMLTDLAADADHDYFIRVRAKAGTFTADDRIRVLVTSSREGFIDPKTGVPTEAIRFLDASRKSEIFPPADNPLVLTVGDLNPESAVGPTADHRRKPDIVLEDSRASFTNGDLTGGASNAAAYFAGVVVLLKAAEPGLSNRHLLWFAHNDGATRVAAETGSTEPGPSQQSTNPSDTSKTPADPSRRGTLSRRLANLAATAPLQNSAGPLQVRAPYFEFFLDPRRQPASSAVGRASFYSPLRLRAGDFELQLPPRNSGMNRSVPGSTNTNAGSMAPPTSAPRPELLRAPHKADETQPAGQVFLWKTPTREHLANVVRGQGMKD